MYFISCAVAFPILRAPAPDCHVNSPNVSFAKVPISLKNCKASSVSSPQRTLHRSFYSPHLLQPLDNTLGEATGTSRVNLSVHRSDKLLAGPFHACLDLDKILVAAQGVTGRDRPTCLPARSLTDGSVFAHCIADNCVITSS